MARPRRYHFAIDAVGLRAESGGAVVLRDVLSGLSRSERVARQTLFVHEAPRWLEPELLSGLHVVISTPGSRFELLRWNRSGLGRAAAVAGADAVVSINAMGTASLPVFVLFQQQLMFEPGAVALMPRSFRWRLRAMRLLARSACRSARLVLGQTERVRRCLIEDLDVPAERVAVMPCDVHWPSGLTPAGSRASRSLLYVGSARPYKSLDTLLSAFAQLQPRFPELELVLTVPSGTVAPRRGVRCIGQVDRARVWTLLSEATLAVMPSLAESLGLPLLEALDRGCPLVAVDLPYAREACGDAAVYFAPRDAQHCAEQIAALLEDEALRARLAEEGKRRLAAMRRVDPYGELAKSLIAALDG